MPPFKFDFTGPQVLIRVRSLALLAMCCALHACRFDPAGVSLEDNALPPTCLDSADYLDRPNSEHRYRFVQDGLVYDQAYAACAADGAHLAVIDDRDENQFVVDLVAGEQPWLGMNDLALEGDFAWVTGAQPGLDNWANNEPNDSGGDEDCGMLRPDGQWNDAECNNQRSYVCECDPDYRARPAPMCLQSGNYSEIRQGRRYFSSDEAVTFADARERCAADGGHLVAITDITENDYVYEMKRNNRVWIGLADGAEEGVHTWVTGAGVEYDDWGGGQPDNSGRSDRDDGQEDCVEMVDNGSWNDIWCEREQGFVCECAPGVVDIF